MTIGELATGAGVPTPTVRYYERRGLIRPTTRSPAGYRVYDAAAAERLRFIRHAQSLGFSLDDIGELLGLCVTDPASCTRVASRAREKLAETRHRIAELEKLERLLAKLVASCDAHEPSAECPVLSALVADVGG